MRYEFNSVEMLGFYFLGSNRIPFHPLGCDVPYLMECSGVVFYPLNEIRILVIEDEK